MVELSFKNMLLYTVSEHALAVALIADMEKRALEMLDDYIEDAAVRAGIV